MSLVLAHWPLVYLIGIETRVIRLPHWKMRFIHFVWIHMYSSSVQMVTFKWRKLAPFCLIRPTFFYSAFIHRILGTLTNCKLFITKRLHAIKLKSASFWCTGNLLHIPIEVLRLRWIDWSYYWQALTCDAAAKHLFIPWSKFMITPF